MQYVVAVFLCGGVAVGAEPMPDEVPAVKVSYEDVFKLVKAGGDVKVAFGVPAPPGYVRVDDVPEGVKPGLRRCWRDANGEPAWELVSASKPATPRPPLLPYTVLPNVQALMGRQVSTPTC